MRLKLLCSAAALLLASLTSQANASTYQLSFGGSGVSGALTLTYGAGTDSKYPQAIEITGISGTFTDTNIGIINATITGLEPINHATPEVGNVQAPNDFSKYPVAVGTMGGSLSFDNLIYFGGSPQAAPPSDYPFHGGFLDIYGLLFDLNNGDVVNFWSNGIVPPDPLADYGVAVATHATVLDYTGGVAITPEPGTLLLFGTGLSGLIVTLKRKL
jgi:hypothetical protein